MGSILKNILSNALKYTPEDGSVCIYASEEGNSWSIEVKDTGIGIPTCEQKKLFRNYFRGSNVVNLKVTGSGIGLMLVYKLVKLHKGKIQIQSAENQGTCVRITFPKGNSHFHKAKFISPKTPDERLETIVTGDTPGLPDMEISRINSSLQRILIVEDNDDLRNYLVDMLRTGYNIQSCPNGKEALIIIREFNPDLVISDIMMPEMGGDELCATIKGDLEMSHIPVVLLTALGDEKHMLEGLEIGADAYITKPFSLKNLYARIQAVWRRSDHDLKPLAEKFSWNAGDLVIDYNRKEVLKKGETISLTPIEWKILSAFTRYPQKVFTRDELIASAFDTDFSGYDRVIDTHIKNLRKKIEDDPKNPIYLCTVHGIGYKFGGNIQ